MTRKTNLKRESCSANDEIITPSKKVRSILRQNKDHLNISNIKAKTEPQRMMIQSFISGSNIVAVGSAGTGKSFLALYLALKDVIESKLHTKIIIIRSNVPTRNSGFLPGTLEEKNEIYSLPFKQIVNNLCENGSAWDILTKKHIIEFVSTSYIRGLTFDDSIVIVEECQNLDAEEMKTVLTRVGENTQLIICGDSKQGDLFRSREKSCFELLVYISENMPEYIDLINFLPEDIVRSGFVRKLLLLLEDSNFESH